MLSPIIISQFTSVSPGCPVHQTNDIYSVVCFFLDNGKPYVRQAYNLPMMMSAIECCVFIIVYSRETCSSTSTVVSTEIRVTAKFATLQVLYMLYTRCELQFSVHNVVIFEFLNKQ